MGLFGLKTYILSKISRRQYHFESLKQYYFQIEQPYRHRFHEVAALRALMRAARPLRENGNDMFECPKSPQRPGVTLNKVQQ